MFAGIHSVEFNDNCQQILAMKSLDGEVVYLSKPVTVSTEVEVCLCVCVYVCVHTVHVQCVSCLQCMCLCLCLCVFVYRCVCLCLCVWFSSIFHMILKYCTYSIWRIGDASQDRTSCFFLVYDELETGVSPTISLQMKI